LFLLIYFDILDSRVVLVLMLALCICKSG